jgi:hypothetical protein
MNRNSLKVQKNLKLIAEGKTISTIELLQVYRYLAIELPILSSAREWENHLSMWGINVDKDKWAIAYQRHKKTMEEIYDKIECRVYVLEILLEEKKK